MIGMSEVAELHNCHIYSECLGQSHADSLVVSQDSVSSYEPRLVVSVHIENMKIKNETIKKTHNA